MNFKLKNNWNVSSKSGKKVTCKIRIGKLTVIDLYFTIGQPKVVITLFNFTLTVDKDLKPKK